MLRVAAVTLLALCFVAACDRKPTALTATPQGTLTATITETVTTTKTIPCMTVTKDETKSPPNYICTPEGEPPPTGGGGTDPLPTITCPTGSMVITGKWGENTIYTSEGPNAPFNQQWLAIEVKPPVGWVQNSPVRASWVEYIDGAPTRAAMFATQPCTFDQQYALRKNNGTGQVQFIQSGLGFSFDYMTAVSTSAVTLTPGQTYWINAKNIYWADQTPSCSGSCNMRGSLPD